jgi:hypothetical protein
MMLGIFESIDITRYDISYQFKRDLDFVVAIILETLQAYQNPSPSLPVPGGEKVAG